MTAPRCLSPTCHRPDRQPGEQMYCGGIWCSACYRRWVGAGRPDSGPPSRQKNGQASRDHATAARQARIEETVRLATLGWTQKAIATQVGVSESAVRQYLSDYRKAGGVITVSGIETDVLHDIGPERTPGKAAELKVDRRRNGRDFSDEEMEIVAQAHQAELDREAAILNGVVWKQVA